MPKALRLLPPLALALLLAAAFVALRSSPAHATGSQETLFQDDTALHGNTTVTLNTLKGLGVERIRLFVYWGSIAPNPKSLHKPGPPFSASDPATYPAANWKYYDKVVREAAKRGMGVDFTVTGGGPAWASGSGFPGGKLRGIWKPSAKEFGAFVTALGTRYSGTYSTNGGATTLPAVNYWAVWNEPNYGQWLAPQATNHSTVEVGPALYRGLVDAAWTALQKTGHGGDTFLFGETAPRGLTIGDVPGNFGGMVPLRWLRALYCLDGSYNPLRGSAAAQRGCPTNSAGSQRFAAAHPGLFQATGFAAHLYPQGLDPVTHTWPRSGADQYADLPNLPALLRLLDRAVAAYGSYRRFNVYNTEYGYQTMPPAAGHPSWKTAALWLNWAEYLTWRNSRLVTYMQYGLFDPPRDNFPSALEDKHGRRKPTFDAFMMPLFLPSTSTSKQGSLEVWGAARPAHYASGPQQVSIQYQRGSHGAFSTVKTVTVAATGTGYFDLRLSFPASGSVRTSWFSPFTGTTVYSRTQKITIH